MTSREDIIAMMISAFADIEYPGDWCLRGSNEGREPYGVEEEFKGKKQWQTLDPKFLDQSPGGLSSALCFFSDEAFRFYLPAYIIADVNDELESVSPVFHLCSSLTNDRADEAVNPRRYGPRTWRDEAQYKFSIFTASQAAAIVEYLKFLRIRDDFDREMIDQALQNYWVGAANDHA